MKCHLVIHTEAERRRCEAEVIQWIEKVVRLCLYVYVCMFFEDFPRLRALTEPKLASYDRVLDNTMLRHAFGAVLLLARAWHGILVPIGLALWSGQLPPQLHVILAHIIRYQN